MIKYILTTLIFLGAIYAGTMLLPYYLTTITHMYDAKNYWFQLHWGFIHYPSVAYILLSAIVLHISILIANRKKLKDYKKLKKDIIDAIEKLDLNKLNLEEILNSKNIFIKDIVGIARHGGIEEDMELVVEKRVSNLSSAFEKLISEYGYIAAVLPMLGMLGTITGLLQMFAIADGIDNIASKMVGLSVALATTLYATLWVIMIVKPIMRSLEGQLIELENLKHSLVINSKLFLHNIDFNTLSYEENSTENENKSEETNEKKD